MDALVEAQGVEMTFASGRGRRRVNIHVLRKVSFDVGHGETLGLVGESGSGKSTIGRIAVGLHEPTGGSLKLFGLALTGPNRNANLSTVRSRAQFVFQDPHAALNPRMRAGDSIAEPIDVAGARTRRDRNDRVKELLRLVGLPHDAADRFPHEFSGGQRQRIVIARALALEPLFIVCDEPVSALDVSMQAQVGHDLAVVRAVSHRVAVIYAGAIVELAEKNALFASPQHPYTQALLDAVPRPDPSRVRNRAIVGEVPSLVSPPPGCRFHARCRHAMPKCSVDEPALREISPGRLTACHLYGTP
jgi:oligopeptide/dipeptide ABC transporter ATP-binding protein